MRIFVCLALVIAAAGCKRKQPDEAGIPPPAPPTAPAKEPGSGTEGSATATAERADATPAQLPTTEEVRKQLAPALEEVKKCIAQAPPNAPLPDGAVAPIVLRLAVQPGGTINGAEIDGRDRARACVLNAMRGKITLKSWVGPPIGVSIPISLDR